MEPVLRAGRGGEVVVAHARQVRLIAESSRKEDRMDARTLARLDPALLNPVRRRGLELARRGTGAAAAQRRRQKRLSDVGTALPGR